MIEVMLVTFLLFRILYILPLIVPSVLFAKEYRTDKHKFYITRIIITLIIWFIWSVFWFVFLKAYNLTGYKGWVSEIIGVMRYDPSTLPFLYCLVTFLASSIIYVFFCYFLMNTTKLESNLKRRILWYGWIVGFIIIFVVIHQNIKEISAVEWAEPISAFFNYLSFALKWIVFSLPATRKISGILTDRK
ncbi:MAG: hypothetical protein AMJ78_02550 [Omnitrophica WOR_2 bacterium SM23_29]|nr:MAG: hypothetical protein AMJ78_02550 [Omnitrophica WOR_2 bacterium SM23_29]